jgi:hypothetical protein
LLWTTSGSGFSDGLGSSSELQGVARPDVDRDDLDVGSTEGDLGLALGVFETKEWVQHNTSFMAHRLSLVPLF